MRRGRILAVVAPVLLLGGAFAGAAPAAAAGHPGPPAYYLALGDSLAAGVQPLAHGGSVETRQGYAEDLQAALRAEQPDLLFEDLGCPGETTTTMIEGGICSYAQGSQLAAAVAFLETHRVALVTIDIGANDVDGCFSTAGIDTTCLASGVFAVESNLPTILKALETAAPGVPIVAMNYYDPFLAVYLLGDTTLATESVGAAVAFNGLLDSIYADFVVPVADVQGAFETTVSSPYDGTTIPTDVALVCAWTWMCAPAPYGPNIHANRAGYAVIAQAFLATLDG